MGRIFLIEAALLALPLVVALLYGESTIPFLITIVILIVFGCLLGLRSPRDTAIYAREGLVVVALCWILMSAFGALPFYLSGEIPSYIDAFFETVSGFTTTGSSILTDVEAMSQSMLFWRSFTHWIGGMGVLVFAMAVMPMSGGRAMHMMRAEMPGVTVDKLSSKLRDTAVILYAIYFVMTIAEVVLLLIGGMPLFDALISSFGSAGTGGFSNRAASIGAYDSVYVEMVISVFMLLFGVNFNVYYLLLVRRFRAALSSEEMRAYFGIVAAAVLLIALDTMRLFGSFRSAMRYSIFQVSTIITTTGYATTDFNQWPTFSKTILIILMFIGACAGSTGGGFKISRLIILVKSAIQDIRRMLHPHAVATIRFEGKPLKNKTVQSVHSYLKVYVMILVGSTLLVAIDQFDLITTVTSVVACLNNIGPGLELVGPTGNFSAFSGFVKLVLCADMLVGRLEIYPILVLVSPSVWLYRKKKKKR